MIEKKGGFAFIYLSGELSKISEFMGRAVCEVIKFAPFVSATYYGYNSIQKMSEGNYIGAGTKLIEATVSFIPGLSLSQHLLLSGLGLLHDFFK